MRRASGALSGRRRCAVPSPGRAWRGIPPACASRAITTPDPRRGGSLDRAAGRPTATNYCHGAITISRRLYPAAAASCAPQKKPCHRPRCALVRRLRTSSSTGGNRSGKGSRSSPCVTPRKSRLCSLAGASSITLRSITGAGRSPRLGILAPAAGPLLDAPAPSGRGLGDRHRGGQSGRADASHARLAVLEGYLEVGVLGGRGSPTYTTGTSGGSAGTIPAPLRACRPARLVDDVSSFSFDGVVRGSTITLPNTGADSTPLETSRRQALCARPAARGFRHRSAHRGAGPVKPRRPIRRSPHRCAGRPR